MAKDRCVSCNKGRHSDCLERFCHCHCMSPSVPFRGSGAFSSAPEPLRDLAHPLHLMRASSIVSRTTRDFEVVYKPKPSTLPDHLRAVIQEHRFDLTRVLQAWTTPMSQNRPWWTVDHVASCYGCGKSCALRDPLGHCRHVWCGWVGQVQERIKIVTVVGYPKHLAGQGT